MIRTVFNTVVALHLLWTPTGWAEEAMYVTDRLLADVHAAPEAEGALLARLPTGSRVRVIERGKRYSNVRLSDGTEGWMRTGKLQEDKPAQMLLLALSDHQERMATELRELRRQLAALEQREDDAALMQFMGYGLSHWGVLMGMIILLVLGFGLGVLWLDHRIRERHGGFRV